MHRFVWLAGLVCLAMGCGTDGARPVAGDGQCWRADPAAAAPPAHAEDSPTMAVNDRRLIGRLMNETSRLKEAGRTVKIAALIEQLKTARCRLDLATPPKEIISAEALYERAKESVVVVGGPYKCEKCGKIHMATASAFVIAAGACVTSYHVVDEPKKETLVVMTFDGRVLPVKGVLAASKADDVAILQVEGLNSKPLALAPGAPVGSRVRVIGHPDGRFYALTEGIVSRYLTLRRGEADVAMMAITADFARGSSGAPVLNECGAVVGIAATTHSVYYDESGARENLQMVVKQCVPAASVLKLVQP
jgi:S1-C subfamily serine protease